MLSFPRIAFSTFVSCWLVEIVRSVKTLDDFLTNISCHLVRYAAEMDSRGYAFLKYLQIFLDDSDSGLKDWGIET